jgi:hypothetical protein
MLFHRRIFSPKSNMSATRSMQSQRVFRHPQLINSEPFMLKYVYIIRYESKDEKHS